MAEDLLPSDVATYTKGAIPDDDPDVERALRAALQRARNFCGWHVSPVLTHTFTLDSPGRRELILPTLKPVSVKVDGEEITPDIGYFTDDEPGVLKRVSGFWPCGKVAVELEHGFAAAEAEDFREAVLSLVDQAAQEVGTGRHGPLISKRVDDVHYSWSGLPASVANSPLDKDALATYRLWGFA